MTPQEFKAWFDGFTEALDGLPSKDQWKRIKERVVEIDGKTTTYPVYVDRYWSYPRPWNPYWGTYCANSSNLTGAATITGMASGASGSSYVLRGDEQTTPTFDSATAMYALGKADAQSMSTLGGGQ